MDQQEKMKALRGYLKDTIRSLTDFSATDQARGVPMPPVQKPVPEGETPVGLPEWRGTVCPEGTLDSIIGERKSERKYLETPLSAEEISFLLWATQGVRQATPGRVSRTVPSAGNRHSTETYLALTRPALSRTGGSDLQPGLWRYLPLNHALLFLGCPDDLSGRIGKAVKDRAHVVQAPAVFFWACIPYRTEWRYAEASHKVIVLDAGHICQNLYLAAGAIGCGTCAVAGYDQAAADALFHLDGEEEFILYLAPVGKTR